MKRPGLRSVALAACFTPFVLNVAGTAEPAAIRLLPPDLPKGDAGQAVRPVDTPEYRPEYRPPIETPTTVAPPRRLPRPLAPTLTPQPSPSPPIPTPTVARPAQQPPWRAQDVSIPDQSQGLVIFMVRDAGDPLAAGRAAGVEVVESALIEAVRLRMVVARLRPDDALAVAIKRLEALPQVAWAQADHNYQSLAGPALPRAFELHDLGAADLARPATGVVAMIDTMVAGDHPVFRGGALQQRFYRSPMTPAAHGTAVASLIAGRAEVIGAGRGALLVNLAAFVQISPDGAPRSQTRYIAKALDAAAALRPNVLNLSFGGPEDRLLAALVAAINARGVCMVAAAGNGGRGGRTPFPASHPLVVAVTAVDERLAPYPLATPGPAVDVAALGVDLVAATPGGYRRVSGSSFAAAIVSGALLRTPACARDRDPAAMRAAITGAARDLGRPGRDPLFGAGLFRLPAGRP